MPPTDPFQDARRRMVEQQLRVPGRDISDPRVVNAMLLVPRHLFVPAGLEAEAYGDHPVPLGHGQTLSQPYMVAAMVQALQPRATDRVLEVGTGSGYAAAVFSHLVDRVEGIEIMDDLARRARETLAALHVANVHVHTGDGSAGWPAAAPYDGILVSCAPERVPRALVEQLRDGGRMVIPVGTGVQELLLLQKQGDSVGVEPLMGVRFVPMVSAVPG